MKFGIIYANMARFADLDGLTELAVNAEAAGFDSLWTVEHVVYPEGYTSKYPYDPSGRMPADGSAALPDPLIWLTAVAARTKKMLLGTGILILPPTQPAHPGQTGRDARRTFGWATAARCGVGWLEEEFNALGVPFEQRGARADDYMAAMRAIWATDDASYDGTFASYQHLTANPKASQRDGSADHRRPHPCRCSACGHVRRWFLPRFGRHPHADRHCQTDRRRCRS
ncbi:MAG: LLM class flavin-dependent oxidoreductase [Acidimicrobiia bacterium]|nr:LLM class flavin-dependent oxidoreductase [Acidimicrobiia bacterium]